LRCFYCMPEEGIRYLPQRELLTFTEIERLVSILATLGVSKVRVTGGEPFVRPDLMTLLARIQSIEGINDVHITTNGILTGPHIPALKRMGIASVNLSMDTLDPARYREITRRDEFAKTWDTLQQLVANEIAVKVNAVVMEDKNIDDLVPLVELTRHQNISVRFIEEMPFNGEGSHYPQLRWTYQKILAHLRVAYPDLQKIADAENATAYHYQVPGFRGHIGIIAAFSRTFCGSCNRIRITAQGTLKTCLYDDGVLDLKALLRGGKSDVEITEALRLAFAHRAKDGLEAEAHRHKKSITESMSTIGG